MADNAMWRQTAYLKPLNPGMSDELDGSVAIYADGATVAVGQDRRRSVHDAALNAGAVYVFTYSNAWAEQAHVKASNPAGKERFGTSLALSGDGSVLTAGAVGEDRVATGVGGRQDDDSAEQAGVAYLFRRSGVTWSQFAYVRASNTGASYGPDAMSGSPATDRCSRSAPTERPARRAVPTRIRTIKVRAAAVL